MKIESDCTQLRAIQREGGENEQPISARIYMIQLNSIRVSAYCETGEWSVLDSD